MSTLRVRSARLPLVMSAIVLLLCATGYMFFRGHDDGNGNGNGQGEDFTQLLVAHAGRVIDEGQHTFRFDTFGDEDFWGGTLRLNEAIGGSRFGGVGSGVSPRTALAVGLKVDVDALPRNVVEQLKHGRVNLDDVAVTMALLQNDAVVGVKGFFTGGNLSSMGITCALCHSTVDNSLAPGVGHRLDGFANHDLNVGAIVALAPNLAPVASLLGTTDTVVRQVLNSWGPGKFDAELFFDGKAFNPQQVTDGVVTGTNVSGATMIPNAFGLAGFNQHTWTGGWGTVTYWNALVAVLEMHGKGSFFDPRLDNAAKFPIAAKNGFGHISINADDDRVTRTLPALQIYQLLLTAPTPQPGVDFDPAAAARGDALFGAKARCGTCHNEPLWTEPGWNLHQPSDIGVDAFEADRAPDGQYKTMNLAGLFVQERGLFMDPANKGRFYHDGRFATLLDVVNHYDKHFNLGLSSQEKSDLVEYVKSLGGDAGAGGSTTTRAPHPQEQNPQSPMLNQNFPNPFNPQTTISYTLPASGDVRVDVYSSTGQLIRTLSATSQSAGEHSIVWEGKDDRGKAVASGVYFYRLTAGGRILQTKKMLLLK